MKTHIRSAILLTCLMALILGWLLPVFSFTVVAAQTIPEWRFADENTIVHDPNDSGPPGPTTYKKNAGGIFAAQTGGSCPDTVGDLPSPIPAGPTTISATHKTWESGATGCLIGDEREITVTVPEGVGEEVVVEEDGEYIGTCETEGGAFAWLACPLIVGAIGAYEGMVRIIESLLIVRPIQANNNDPVFAVWKQMRNIALVTLLVGALLLIIQQAVKPDTDAYLVKRIVPRLGGAAIGITMSFYVAAIAIDFFNVIGQSIYELLTNTVANALDIQTSALAGFSATIVTLLIAGLGAGGVISAIAGGGPVLSIIGLILLPLILAVLAGFLTILARQLVIVMLVIVSPLAFAAWVLPNTDSWLKKWWKLFSTMLLMYPIIMVLLASGVIMAVIITNGALTTEGDGSLNENNFINYLLALAILGVAIGMIPFTMRVAGGILGKLTGILNNRGPIEGMKKGMQERKEGAKALQTEDARAKQRAGDNSLRTRFRANTMFRGRGKLGAVARQSLTSGSLSLEARSQALDAKARKEELDAAEFRMREEVNRRGDIGEKRAYLRSHFAKGSESSEAERRVAYGMMAKIKDGNGLVEAMNNSYNFGGERGRALADELRGEYFSDIDPWAADIASGEMKIQKDGTGKFQRDYTALGRKTATEMLKSSEDSLAGYWGSGDEGRQTILRAITAVRPDEVPNTTAQRFTEVTLDSDKNPRPALLDGPIPAGYEEIAQAARVKLSTGGAAPPSGGGGGDGGDELPPLVGPDGRPLR